MDRIRGKDQYEFHELELVRKTRKGSSEVVGVMGREDSSTNLRKFVLIFFGVGGVLGMGNPFIVISRWENDLIIRPHQVSKKTINHETILTI